MCFDQCRSRSVGKASIPLTFSCWFRPQFSCGLVYMCVWWQMRGGSHWAHRDRADNLQSLSSGGWVWYERCSMDHKHCPHIQWDFFESFISTLRCQYIHNTYTVSILPPETSKRERLSALMMITGQWSGHTVEEKREFDGQENIDLKGDLRK